MVYIGKDDVLLNKLRKEFSLISSKLVSLVLEEKNGGLEVFLEFELKRKEFEVTILKIKCSGVSEFGFYYVENFIFYNVESFKFIKVKGNFYLALDPDDSTPNESANDQDFIRMNSVSAFISKDEVNGQV